mmetsp:Transcript_39051/g.92120  ORF Transcript_39051/g.92120 Transcript_39051/m.92120 type:complete len:268 (-) Transcript_39051:59-862(-)
MFCKRPLQTRAFPTAPLRSSFQARRSTPSLLALQARAKGFSERVILRAYADSDARSCPRLRGVRPRSRRSHAGERPETTITWRGHSITWRGQHSITWREQARATSTPDRGGQSQRTLRRTRSRFRRGRRRRRADNRKAGSSRGKCWATVVNRQSCTCARWRTLPRGGGSGLWRGQRRMLMLRLGRKRSRCTCSRCTRRSLKRTEGRGRTGAAKRDRHAWEATCVWEVTCVRAGVAEGQGSRWSGSCLRRGEEAMRCKRLFAVRRLGV